MVENKEYSKVSGRLAGRVAIGFSALPSPHLTRRTELMLSPADPFQRPADDRFPLGARCSDRDGLQRREGCLAATGIANTG